MATAAAAAPPSSHLPPPSPPPPHRDFTTDVFFTFLLFSCSSFSSRHSRRVSPPPPSLRRLLLRINEVVGCSFGLPTRPLTFDRPITRHSTSPICLGGLFDFLPPGVGFAFPRFQPMIPSAVVAAAHCGTTAGPLVSKQEDRREPTRR